jgi:hypothetical protein
MSEAMQRQMGQTSAWLLFSGVAFGVVGASANKHAESVGELVVALRGRTENSVHQWLLRLADGACCCLL